MLGRVDSANLQCCYRDNVKYNLYMKFCVPKLFHYAVDGQWDKIPIRCKNYNNNNNIKKEALFVHKYPPSDTALHRLVRPSFGERTIRIESDELTLQRLDSIKIDAIQALLTVTDNTIASIQDSFGRTPLHLACMDITVINVPLIILNSNPVAASIQDIEHRTPLHLLCARNDTIPINLLIELIQYYPQAVSAQDVTGDTPVSILQIRKDEITNVDEAIAILSK